MNQAQIALFNMIRFAEEIHPLGELPVFYTIQELDAFLEDVTTSVEAWKVFAGLNDSHQYFVSVEGSIMLLTDDQAEMLLRECRDDLVKEIDRLFTNEERMMISVKTIQLKGGLYNE